MNKWVKLNECNELILVFGSIYLCKLYGYVSSGKVHILICLSSTGNIINIMLINIKLMGN